MFKISTVKTHCHVSTSKHSPWLWAHLSHHSRYKLNVVNAVAECWSTEIQVCKNINNVSLSTLCTGFGTIYFWLFSKVQMNMKDKYFESVLEIKAAMAIQRQRYSLKRTSRTTSRTASKRGKNNRISVFEVGEVFWEQLMAMCVLLEYILFFNLNTYCIFSDTAYH